MTATACRALVLALGLAGCSSSGGGTNDAGDGGADAAADAGMDTGSSAPCLTCGDGSSDAPLAAQVKGVIDQVCASPDGCHGSGSGNMTLVPGNEFAEMIDVTSFENPPMKRVQPGDPGQSYVYLKLACDGGIFGACMPANSGGSGDPRMARLFHDWIEAGAPAR